MQALDLINTASLGDTFISLFSAFIFGTVIGLEREYRQRTAGLRTNVLVAVASAIFVDMANRLSGPEGSVHVIAYIISGVGFLGAGVIMKNDGSVRGLNTAATLWVLRLLVRPVEQTLFPKRDYPLALLLLLILY